MRRGSPTRRRVALCAAVLAGACALAALPAPAAEPSAWERIRGFAVERKDDAVREARQLMADADAKIADAKRQAADSVGEAKAAHERNLRDLEQKKAAAAEKLEAMQKAGANAWDATKEGFAAAYQDLHQAVRKALP